MALAKAILCLSPPDNLTPSAPTLVLIPSGKFEILFDKFAISIAFSIFLSSIGSPKKLKAMFYFIVGLKS